MMLSWQPFAAICEVDSEYSSMPEVIRSRSLYENAMFSSRRSEPEKGHTSAFNLHDCNSHTKLDSVFNLCDLSLHLSNEGETD